MNNSTNETLLPVAINGQSFTANADGMWDLTAIHKALGLPDSKAPSEWRNAVSAELRASGNLRIIDKVGTLATELGTIAYAMWVSTDFYLMVAGAFVTMRNDAVMSRRLALIAVAEKDAKLATAVPKADLVDRRLAGMGVPWNEACRMAGVTKPQLAKQYLVATRRFVSVEHPTEYRQILKPSSRGFDSGFFKHCSSRHGNDDGFRVTAKGFAWLQSKAQEINSAIAERARKKATKARAAKRAAMEVTQ
ncbi:TPA: KilA-N domain-containing protein [Pseudomonas putida]|uniref:KilA-N domain-containing protein n=1 Tax=Pseudomonas putida TaxID=303 RepID=UPI000281DF69|nr:KilA-N domain-containing protein [Pseudomonas putida]EMR47092.1 hypothetical protein PPUTLS46_011565 [Pseudomonas putida LS46]HEE9762399.1 KilA-N domain-containing protein [Pseudomonas putida]